MNILNGIKSLCLKFNAEHKEKELLDLYFNDMFSSSLSSPLMGYEIMICLAHRHLCKQSKDQLLNLVLNLSPDDDKFDDMLTFLSYCYDPSKTSKFGLIRTLNDCVDLSNIEAIYDITNVRHSILNNEYFLPYDKIVDLNSTLQKSRAFPAETIQIDLKKPPSTQNLQQSSSKSQDLFTLCAYQKELITIKSFLEKQSITLYRPFILSLNEIIRIIVLGCTGISSDVIFRTDELNISTMIREHLDFSSTLMFISMFKQLFHNVRLLTDMYQHKTQPLWYQHSLHQILTWTMNQIASYASVDNLLLLYASMEPVLFALKCLCDHFFACNHQLSKYMQNALHLAIFLLVKIAFVEETMLHMSKKNLFSIYMLSKLANNAWNVYISAINDVITDKTELNFLSANTVIDSTSDRFSSVVSIQITKICKMTRLLKLLMTIDNKNDLLAPLNLDTSSGSPDFEWNQNDDKNLDEAKCAISLCVVSNLQCLSAAIDEECLFDSINQCCSIAIKYKTDWLEIEPITNLYGPCVEKSTEGFENLNNTEFRLQNLSKCIDTRLSQLDNELFNLVIEGKTGLFCTISNLCDVYLLQSYEITRKLSSCFRNYLLNLEIVNQLSNSLAIANFRIGIFSIFQTVRNECSSFNLSIDSMKCYHSNNGLEVIDAISLDCKIPYGLTDIVNQDIYKVCFKFQMKLLYTSLLLDNMLSIIREKEKSHGKFLTQFLIINQHRYEMFLFVRSVQTFSEFLITNKLDWLRQRIEGIKNSDFELFTSVHDEFVHTSLGCWGRFNNKVAKETSFNIAVSLICQRILEYWKTALICLSDMKTTKDFDPLIEKHVIFRKHLNSFFSALRICAINNAGDVIRPLLLTLNFNQFYGQ